MNFRSGRSNKRIFNLACGPNCYSGFGVGTWRRNMDLLQVYRNLYLFIHVVVSPTSLRKITPPMHLTKLPKWE